MSQYPDIGMMPGTSSSYHSGDLDDDVGLRKRRIWNPDTDSLGSNQDIDLLDDDDLDDDEGGCPLPSTPEDNQLLEAEVCLIHLFLIYFI